MCLAQFAFTGRLLVLVSSPSSVSAVAQCTQVYTRCCCCSRRVLRARSNRPTTGTANYTSRLLSHRRIGQLGVVAPSERNCSGREAGVEIGRLEPLLSRPGPPFDRAGHTGHMVGLLKKS